MTKFKAQNKSKYQNLNSKINILAFLICHLCLFWILCFGICHSVYAFQPPLYQINATIDVKRHTIKARQKITFTNNSNNEITCAYFHIYPNRKYNELEKRFILRYSAYFKINPYPEGFKESDLKISSVSWGGEELRYEIEGQDKTILKVYLPRGVPPTAGVTLEMDFEVGIPHAYGRFGWHKNIISLLRWYPMLSVLDKYGWHSYPFYPYHQPYFSEASSYQVNISCPGEQVVIHSGILKNQKINPDGTKTLLIASSAPLRDFGIALSADYKLESQEVNGIKINSYYLKGDKYAALKALEFASSLIEKYSKDFMTYPYREFNIAPSYLAYGGTQSSGLILIDTRVYRLPRFLSRYFDFIISHETGHQWFYNLVGSDEYKEMFIDEGFNSFFVLRHLKNKYAPEAKIMVLPKALTWFVPNFSFERAQLDRYGFVSKGGLDRPVLGDLSSFQEPSSIFSITYGKGSKIVDMLDYVMGKDAFQNFIQRYFQEYKFKNISVSDLQDLASNVSKVDLSWFFKQWLRTSRKCDYAVKDARAGKVIIENRGNISMPVDVRVVLKDAKTLNLRLSGAEKEKVLSIGQGADIKSVQLDPDKRILDSDRINNSWPRKIDVRPVPLYYPVYETSVFLKDDAYSLIFGPQVGSGGLGARASLQRPQDNIAYASCVYDFSEERLKNILGFEQRNLFGKLIKGGIEGFYYSDAHGQDDQNGAKLYLRRELWPVSYGFSDENDHITFYLLRNRDFKSALSMGALEDIRNLYYRHQEEAILGINFKIGRYGPYPDVSDGWKFKTTLENAEHFLGGQNYFWRISPELSRYFNVTPGQNIAARVKFGIGWPADKGLFQLGGEKGLRGYAYKTINGSQSLMLNMEYRRDIAQDLNLRFFDNIVSLNKIQGVGFFDLGKSWFRSFDERSFKKDVGLGLRFHLGLGSFLENIILRFDAAQAINEPKAKVRYWFGIEHAF